MNCKERLTIKDGGDFIPKELCITDKNGNIDGCDNCENKCNDTCGDCDICPIQKCFDRLGELEDKIENGTLIELPWEVGDIVYILDYEDDIPVDYSGYIFIMANNDFAFLSPSINGEENPCEICNEHFQRFLDNQDNSGIIVPINEIFTKEEAEARRKELQNK